ncbi:MAG: DUF3467 domain-containing protein [Deltaproteobacteria bacterium]|nr:DUF3467 domain-containing protein [Deltaproteobacteria bacterium]
MIKSDPQQPQQIQVNTTDEISRGRYSNLMFIAHSPDEFMIDWLMNSPNGTHLVSRIIVSPGHAKRMIEALMNNVQQYEEKYGEIKVIDTGDQQFNLQ